jgi:putative transposase
LKKRGYLPRDVRITSATVCERAARWVVSIHTDEQPVRQNGTETLGVERHLATLSDGTVFENPRSFKVAETRLRRVGKSVSRKVNGSRNRAKAVARLSRQHYRVSCIREDAIHKSSDAIAKRAAILGMEILECCGHDEEPSAGQSRL